jgi:hypothetical protein
LAAARTGKTIANFRRNNRKAIREVCRAFTHFCRDLDLFSRDLVAIDGSKFKAVNSRERNFTDRKLQQAIQDIDKKIEAYLDELDANDEEEPDEPKLSAGQLKEKIKLLKERMKKVKGLQRLLDESDQSQISVTDPDARFMPIGGGRVTDVGYNVQVAVDPKHKLIVAHEVTNQVTERGLLPGLSGQDRQPDGPPRQRGARRGSARRAHRHGLLRRPADKNLPGSGRYSLHPQTQHLRQHPAGSLWKRRLPLRPRERLLWVPGRRAAHLPLSLACG